MRLNSLVLAITAAISAAVLGADETRPKIYESDFPASFFTTSGVNLSGISCNPIG